MTTNPPFQPSHLTQQPRPYSPSLRHLHNSSPALLSRGSATQTLTSTPTRSESPEPLVLRLRGAHTPLSTSSAEGDDSLNPRPRRRSGQHIQWAEDVIDNEGLNRKKSKVCCIYHKARIMGESSDESSSDSESESDSNSDSGRDGARMIGSGKGKARGHGHPHHHDHGHGNGDDCSRVGGKRRPSPNAYERMPKYDVKPLTEQPGRN